MGTPVQPPVVAKAITTPTSFLNSSVTMSAGTSPITLIAAGTNVNGITLSCASLSVEGQSAGLAQNMPLGSACLGAPMFFPAGQAITLSYTNGNQETVVKLLANGQVILTLRAGTPPPSQYPTVNSTNVITAASTNIFYDLAYTIN